MLKGRGVVAIGQLQHLAYALHYRSGIVDETLVANNIGSLMFLKETGVPPAVFLEIGRGKVRVPSLFFP